MNGMKKLFFFLLCAALATTACSDSDADDETGQNGTNSLVTASTFKATGRMTVAGNEPFVKEDVNAEVVLGNNQSAEIRIYGVSFSARMPVTIDMVIPNVTYNKTVQQITLTGDNIIPMAGGNAYERYMVSGLQGTITADSLIISNNYSNIPTIYRGKITLAE